MKRNFFNAIYVLGAVYILSGCQVRIPSQETPDSRFYGYVDQVRVSDGFPKKAEPWVVISDRANNSVFVDKGDEKSPKEIKFLEPLLVVKQKESKNLVKVAEYNPDALMKKIPSRSVKTYGWIPKDQLLLWSNSLKRSDNGFNVKAVLSPNNSDVLKNGSKYLKNDSVLIFSSPDLTKPINKKLPVGQLVYIYKQSESNHRFLIGKSPSLKIDSISKDIYGWVSSNMIANWGDRTALKVASNFNYAGDNSQAITKQSPDGSVSETKFEITDAVNRSAVENLVSVSPATIDSTRKARFFTNALDYSKNFVYNVLGQPVYYDRFKEITNRSKNLNIIFTVDISRNNTQNAALAKSVFQDIQLKLDQLKYFRNIKYGVVLYKNNTCGEDILPSSLSNNFEEINSFIDVQSANQNCSSNGAQPLQEALEITGEMISKVPDETNIVVVVGSTASNYGGLSSAMRNLTLGRAKMLFFQSASGSSDFYNNFVLLSENILTSTARNIAELDKSRIVDQKMILDKNNYNLVMGEGGVYSLDYPKASMSQGFVVYPKKGEINSSNLLVKSLDSLIVQVTDYNTNVNASLKSYFKSAVGSSKTTLKPDFRNQFADAPALIPTEATTQLITYDNPFVTKGTYSDEFKESYPAVEKGILLSESEYDKLRAFYQEVYQETKSFSPTFSQGSAINSYVKALKKYYSGEAKFDKSKLKNQSMAYSVAVSTGFDNASEETLSKYKLNGWKKPKVIASDNVKNYFKQYKTLADRLLNNKSNPKVIIDQNGEKFYWLNRFFMPTTQPVESL
ncbi:MAG: VWA domain-containing protein [Chryseobacterium sp.]|nr:VWA domain-containing protein [Chryseobacterium sp.]